jgi:nickel transport protein
MRQSLIVFGFLLLLVIVLCPSGVRAHGTAYRVISNTATVAAEFSYSDGEPMRYADVLVFSPRDENVEYQNGRTDRNGRFAFTPETSGTWHIEVRDGMGHRVEARLTVDDTMSDGGGSGHPDRPNESSELNSNTLILKAALGLSLMLNLFVGFYMWKIRKRRLKCSST